MSIKAEAICDYLEHQTREGYATEKTKEAGDGKGGKAPATDWRKFRQSIAQ